MRGLGKEIKIGLSERELGWIEGLIDSDGSLMLYRERTGPRTKLGYQFRARMDFGSTNHEIVKRLKETIGCGCSVESTTPGGKPFWHYRADANLLRALLPEITLVVKERQRRILLEALPLIEKGRSRTGEDTNRLEWLTDHFREDGKEPHQQV